MPRFFIFIFLCMHMQKYKYYKKMDQQNPPHISISLQEQQPGILQPNKAPLSSKKQQEKTFVEATEKKMSLSQQSSSSIITNRINHCTFIYKNWVYIYGGSQVGQNGKQINEVVQMQSRKESLWNSFHKININTKQITKQNINYGSYLSNFVNISHFGYFVFGNILYVFGGMDYQVRQIRQPQMYSINLDSGSVKRYESKTPSSSIPCGRLFPIVTGIQKSIILIFGGQINCYLTTKSIYVNDMYILKLQTKTWVKIENTNHLRFPLLKQPFLITYGDNTIYMIGGMRKIVRNNGQETEQQSNKIYRIKIVSKTANAKYDYTIKQIYSSNMVPNHHNYVKIFRYQDKGIIAVTSKDKDLSHSFYFWYYEPSSFSWVEIKKKLIGQQIGLNYSCFENFVVSYQKIICLTKAQETIELNFNQNDIETAIKNVIAYYPKNLCLICQDQQLTGVKKTITPAEYLEQYCSPLQFPYASLGLLLNFANYTGAKSCNICFNSGSLSKEANVDGTKNIYITIEDNGSPSNIWRSELKPTEYVSQILKLCSTIPLDDLMNEQDAQYLFTKNLKQIQEKEKTLTREYNNFKKNQAKTGAAVTNYVAQVIGTKSEKDFEKEHQQLMEKREKIIHRKKIIEIDQKCRKFCNVIKIAGISLGDFIAYACKQKKSQDSNPQSINPDKEKQIRRYFFMRKQKCVDTGSYFYVTYAYITENGNVADSKIESMMKFCLKEFKRELKVINDKLKTMNSVILISDLKNCINFEDGSQRTPNKSIQKQLRLKKKINDVIYGESAYLNALQAQNSTKYLECLDVSLKTYLGLLYLKGEQLQLFLSVKENQLEQINSQPFLNTIDRLLSSKRIVQISKSLDFSDQCQVVEVYWNPDKNTRLDSSIGIVNAMGFLLNGILIYQNNKLVSRYKVPLGRLLDELELQQRCGQIFGFLEIKPDYGTNLYGTDLFYPGLFEKYYSRIEFVTYFMENNYKQKRGRSKEDYHNSLNHQKISKKSKNQ